ncbi:MAG: PF20097 family protein [Thermoplasmata archaeon]|nr:PF20097 family protein [Thermoplasmata archaeon]
MRCPKCGAKNRDDEAFCISCGVEIKAYIREQESLVKCPSCGRPNDGDSEFCISCGQPLGASEPPSAPSAVPREEMHCPRCQQVMVPGFLITPNGGPIAGGLVWSEEPSSIWGRSGEQITEGVLFKSYLDLPAWRCPGCRTIAFSY